MAIFSTTIQVQKLETQESHWNKFQPECGRPSSHLETEEANSPLHCFSSLQASQGLEDAHPRSEGQSALFIH